MQLDKPIVSVIMPTYNQGNFLVEAIDSVLHQTYTNLEFIIVNDGSTDDTREILEDYAKRFPQLTVVHQENRRLPRALNRGFDIAHGELLTWTSSDNRMLPNMVEVLAHRLVENPGIGLVYADWRLIRDDGRPMGEVKTFNFNRFLLMRLNFINVSFMYRRKCQDAVGVYDPEFIYVEDWEYWLRISKGFRFMRVPQFLYEYRVHAHSMTGNDKTRPTHIMNATARLQNRLKMQNHVGWYWSKVLYGWLSWKNGRSPGEMIQPYLY